MKTKICTKCKKEKSLDEFYKRTSRISGLDSWCKKCQDKYRQERRRKNYITIQIIKIGRSCEICGYNKCPEALVFHHRNPNKKDFTIGQMMADSFSEKKILEEIKKCQVLCANCHRELHYNLRR